MSPYVFHSPRPCSTDTSASRLGVVTEICRRVVEVSVLEAVVRSDVGIMIDILDVLYCILRVYCSRRTIDGLMQDYFVRTKWRPMLCLQLLFIDDDEQGFIWFCGFGTAQMSSR